MVPSQNHELDFQVFEERMQRNADILRKIFGIRTYSDLNDLTQDQLLLILLTLESEFYHREEAFCTQMDELKPDGAIPKDFKAKSM